MISSVLESAGFQPLEIPEGEGAISELIEHVSESKKELSDELASIESKIEQWTGEHGAELCVGLELLEMDFSESEAPVKIAVTDHTFVIDGWVTDDRSEEVIDALGPYCQHIEYEPVKPTISNHHHHEGHTSEPKPPSHSETTGPLRPWSYSPMPSVGRTTERWTRQFSCCSPTLSSSA